uniref:uncharacterized protein LOC101312683 n=1 Tax=Fragaria vesca subsp. vesca TaxID=101020 RepID=UPI0005C8BED2|nr:PREDICTED: uncharacterized protein LOC101312683 [Fragaria vesca subsp. vesca]
MLEQLPDLQLNGELCVGSINSFNCTSLQAFPDPSDLCRFNTIGNLDSSYLLYSILKRLLEETPPSFHYFSLVFPGSYIFEWFSNQSVGDSVTEKIPYSCNSSKWIGIAVCALFAAQDNPSAVPEERDLNPDENSVTSTLRFYSFRFQVKPIGSVYSFHYPVKQQVDSDHLIFSVFSTHYLQLENFLEDTLVKCVFETHRPVRNNRCLKVKKCGARALYEHDMEELIAKMNQSKSKSVYEQGSANVEEQRSCGYDDEYYSAEE